MTNKQKQCLLKYLGYYEGLIDGSFGPASTQATVLFQTDYAFFPDGSFGPATEKKIKEVVGTDAPFITDWDGVRYFRRQEFRCKCRGKYCNGYPVEINPRLVGIADGVRAHFGAPANISSGIRCTEQNRTVGGAVDSRHLQGKAMDFHVEGKSSKEVLDWVLQQPGVHYAYAIDPNFVHMDVF